MISNSKAVKYYEYLISSEIKYLIETLHLYQNHKLRIATFEDWFGEDEIDRDKLGQKEFKDFKEIYEQIPLLQWVITKWSSESKIVLNNSEDNNLLPIKGYLEIEAPSPVKLYCSICKAIEPFNISDHFSAMNSKSDIKNDNAEPITQLIIIKYQCQSCRGLPETFLVRRKGLKLSLHGRSPIEQFPVNKNIPKDLVNFISDSRIAFNSGQILAAIFLMRTFIEQYIRNKVQDFESREIDQLFDRYSAKLPRDFNSRFPSLKSVYDRLSEDIHSASASEETYNEAKDDIENHFEALRLFEKHNLIDW